MPVPSAVSIELDVLNRFMPMAILLDSDWRVQRIGPTLQKLGVGLDNSGKYLLDIFDVTQPRRFLQAELTLRQTGGKIKGYFKDIANAKMKGFVQKLSGGQGFLVDFSLGAGLAKAVQENGLMARDFSHSDASLDLLYLVEVQQALLAEARRATFKMSVDRRSALSKADSDPLTGLSNRRGLDAFVQRIMGRKTFVPFALIMIDLDFFKAVNDTHGHAAGDAVLREVAQRLLNLTRRGDLVARSGGDEFNIILPNFTGASAAKGLSERIIDELQKPVLFNGKSCQIGASIGMTIVSKKIDFHKTEQAVDRALYTSKQSGRGTVTIV